MSRIALLNMIVGFLVITVSAMAGPFLVQDISTAFVNNPDLIHQWTYLLQKSSHGHTNLFGILHVLMGLTIPYSSLSTSKLKLQSLGLLCGTIAMSVGMMIKSRVYPIPDSGFLLDFVLGFLLALSLLSLVCHVFGLALKFYKR